MIRLWLIVMVIASAHWSTSALPVIWQTAYSFDATPCGLAYACYDNDTIVIDLTVARIGEIRHIAFHEMQHRMTHTYGIWPADNDWSGFMELVADLVAAGELNTEQVVNVGSWIGCPESLCQFNELHAELPWILEGNIPEYFAYWYPWLELTP